MKRTVIDYKYDAKIRIFALCAMALATCCIPYTFANLFDIKGGWFFALVIGLAFFFEGYFLQKLFSKLLHYDRVKSDGTYENNESYVDFKKMLPALGVSLVLPVVVGIVLGIIIHSDMDLAYYFPHMPYVIPIVAFAVSVAGILSWFFPVDRLCERRNTTLWVLVDIAVYLISVLLMGRFQFLFSFITSMFKNRGPFNIFGFVTMLISFIALLVMQVNYEKHYQKLNNLYRDLMHDRSREKSKKWKPKDSDL